MTIYSNYGPVNSDFSDEQKNSIRIGLNKWKMDNQNIFWSDESEQLFWILCNYDHNHCPSNWESRYNHHKTIAQWVVWFHETHLAEVTNIVHKSHNVDNKEFCQNGKISNHLFKYMIEYYT